MIAPNADYEFDVLEIVGNDKGGLLDAILRPDRKQKDAAGPGKVREGKFI